MTYIVENIQWENSGKNLPDTVSIPASELKMPIEREAIFDEEDSAIARFLFEEYGEFAVDYDFELEEEGEE